MATNATVSAHLGGRVTSSIEGADLPGEKKDNADQPAKDIEFQKKIEFEKWKKRQEEIASSPEMKSFVANLDRAIATGKLDDETINSIKEMGRKSLQDKDISYYLQHHMYNKGIGMSVDENGVTLQRTEGYPKYDGIGHPTLPSQWTTTTLTLPFKGNEITGTSHTTHMGFGREESIQLNKEQAIEALFPKPSKREDRYPWLEKTPIIRK